MGILNKDIENKTDALKASMSEKFEDLGYGVEKFSRNIGNDIGSAVNSVSRKASGYVRTTRDYVEENPLQSVAIATATGIAVGSLLTMALRKKQ